jgi:hypothetical protein
MNNRNSAMNKRNTILLCIVLALVVLALVARQFKRWDRHHYRVDRTEQAENVKELLSDACTGFQELDSFPYPIVIRYLHQQWIGNTLTKCHILCPNETVLATCPNQPDSLEAVYVDAELHKNSNKKWLLGIYRKLEYEHEMCYQVHFPVRDSLGLHLMHEVDTISYASTQEEWLIVLGDEQNRWVKRKDQEFFQKLERCMIKSALKKIQAAAGEHYRIKETDPAMDSSDCQ